MKTITTITCRRSPSILMKEGKLSLSEVKEFISYEGFLDSDYNSESDDSDIDITYYDVDLESNEITNYKEVDGKLMHHASSKISESYWHQNVIDFAK